MVDRGRRLRRVRGVGVLTVLVLAACGSTADDRTVDGTAPGSTAIRTGPLTPDDPNRITREEAAAIVHLGDVADPSGPPPGDHAHNDPGPQVTFVLTDEHQAEFETQWDAAVESARHLATPEEAAGAGYVTAAAPGPGVGTHWVKWSLIDAPFDPANPAMLLFDGVGDDAELVGFSYWLRSVGGPPKGFAGPNDTWHQHTGLCVVNGWVDREMSASPAACAGTFLGGGDLWMLHAWVVEDWTNRWGDFAVMNPSLCPALEGTPELARCPTETVL